MGGVSGKIRLTPSLSLVNTGFLFYFTGSLTSTGTGIEVQEGQTITFTVTPNAAVNAATTLVLNVKGQALGGVTNTTTAADFETAANVTFAQGETAAKTITLKVAADTATEGREAYAVDVLDTTAYASRSNTVAGVVTDALPNLTLTASATSVNEGAAVTYTVTSSVAAPTGGLTIPFTLGGTATSADYTASATGNIVIAAGATTGTLVINATADNLTDTAGETVSVQLGTVSGANVVTTTPVVTTINDTSVALAANAFSLSGAATANEGTSVVYTITRGAAATVATTVPYTITGIATSGADYTAQTGTASFAVGATTATITLPITADLLTEGSETVIVTLGTPSVTTDIVTTGAGSVTTTITDSSTTPVVSAFTLTASNNTATNGIDNVTGTTYNAINGLIDMSSSATTPGSASTWNLTDTIAPTASANAALNLTIVNDGATSPTGAVAAAVSLSGYTATGLSSFDLKVVDTSGAYNNSTTFDLSSITGLTTASVANSSTITPSGSNAVNDTVALATIPATAKLLVNSNGQYTNVSGTWVTSATQGSADTVNMTISGRSGAVTIGTGFETAAITTTSSDARVASLTGSTFKTVTVAGAGLKVDGVMDSTITSFDASSSSGVVDVYLTPGSTLTSAKGGSGSSDILAVTSVPTTLTTLSGFEKILAEATATYNLVSATGVTKLGVDVAVSGTVAPTFTNVPASANTIEISGGAQRTTVAAASNALAAGAISYTPAVVSSTTDALTLALSNGGTTSTGSLTLGGVTTSGVESVTITAADFTSSSNSSAVTLGGLTLGSITALSSASVTASGAANVNFGAIDISSAPATTTSTINFSGMTGKTTATLNASVVNNLTYTGGSSVDTITNAAVAAGKTQAYNLGAGNDVFTFLDVASATSVLSVNGGDGDDTFNAATYTTGTSTSSILDGGAGTADSLVFASGVSMVGLKNIANIEKIQAQVTGAIVDGGAVSGDTIEVTNFASGTGRLQVTADTAGATVNLSNFTFIGANSGAIINGGAGVDVITGTSSADTIIGLASGDTIVDGAGVDVISSGAGADTITLSTDSAADVLVFGNSGTVTGDTDLAFGSLAGADTITGFTGGAGGDDLRFDISGFGLAGGTEYVGLIGALTVDSSDEIVVLTAVGYATDEAAEDAIAGRVTTDGLDMVAIYFNTTDNKAHIIHDADAGVDGTGTVILVGTVNVTGSVVGGMATDFLVGNLSSFA